MGYKSKNIKWNRVLIDVCTQQDFLQAGSILQVANRELLVAKLQQVFAWAKQTGTAMVSIVESHRPTEPLAGFPLHCIDGTPGQAKPDFAQLQPSMLIEVDNTLSLPVDLLERYQQLIFRKRARDVLGNPKADRFLTQLEAEEFVIFGVGLDRTIRPLALALLARHKKVAVVSDACGYWSVADSDLALRQLAAKNVRLVTTDELTAPPEPAPPRRVGQRVILSRYQPSSRRGQSSRQGPSSPTSRSSPRSSSRPSSRSRSDQPRSGRSP